MNLKEELKNAICNNDYSFFEINKNRFSINERLIDEDNDTLLLYSISDAGSNMYEYFLKKGADINLLNDEGENVVHGIVFSGDNKRLKNILDNYKVDIDLQATDGATPLLLATSLEKNEIALSLIKYGARVHIADSEGITPLHLASQLPDLILVKSLVENGADIFSKTNNGNLPIALAVNANNIEIAKYLYRLMYD